MEDTKKGVNQIKIFKSTRTKNDTTRIRVVVLIPKLWKLITNEFLSFY